MRVHKEIIWHFTCLSCSGYWSIGTMDEWKPKIMFCPHCGGVCKKIIEHKD
jgi:rRNA maturation endonuclease Nob1